MILRSADGWLFATQRAYLIAASSVFEDMFKVPQPEVTARGGLRKEGQVAPGVLPTVELAETGDELELFLRWIHRRTFDAARKDAFRPSVKNNECVELLYLLNLSRKYNVPTLPILVLQTFAWPNGPVGYMNQLSAGVIFDLPGVVRTALYGWMDEFGSKMVVIPPLRDDRVVSWNPRSKFTHEGWRPTGLADIGVPLFRLLPLGFFRSFSHLQNQVLYHKRLVKPAVVESFVRDMANGFPL